MRRNQNNIGETNQTSVKVHHNPGGKSNWSFGWSQQEKKPNVQKNTNNKYHNQSQVHMNDDVDNIPDKQKQRQQQRRKKEEELNNKLPTYDPKNANKSSLSFGDQKTDYRRKDQVFTSVKVHNPPGGRSNIQFG